MNTLPTTAVEAETPLLQRDVKINAKTLVGGAALAAFVLGALAATAVNQKAPVRPTSLSALPRASDLDPSEFGRIASIRSDTAPVKINRILAADGLELEMPNEAFDYNYYADAFVWHLPPFGGGDDNNNAIYNYDRSTYADKGL